MQCNSVEKNYHSGNLCKSFAVFFHSTVIENH